MSVAAKRKAKAARRSARRARAGAKRTAARRKVARVTKKARPPEDFRRAAGGNWLWRPFSISGGCGVPAPQAEGSPGPLDLFSTFAEPPFYGQPPGVRSTLRVRQTSAPEVSP